MTKVLMILIAAGSLGIIGARIALPADASSHLDNRQPPSAYASNELAANGVVEGARPEIGLRPELSGTIAKLFFRENADVSKGTLLVELDNDTYKEKVALAKAEVDLAKAQLDRLRNGAQKEKRQAMAAMEKAQRSLYRQAEGDWRRTEELLRTRAVSQEQKDADYSRMVRAQAELERIRAERALVEAPARADEMDAARARVAAAEARLRLARAELEKTRLRAPTGGRVLQVYSEPGELASPSNPQPILLLADLSKRRVRAFVEELDSAWVRVGQRALVTADGLPGKKFTGKVAVVVPRMGKRALQSDTPGEYKDLFYREVLIDLEGAEDLPLNLRVQVRIECPSH